MKDLNLRRLRCGGCGEKKHTLYLDKKDNVIAKCTKCDSESIITIVKPKIVIENKSGEGTLCNF